MSDTNSPENDTTNTPEPDVLGNALSDVDHACMLVRAMLEILRSVHPAYKIEAGLYVGNLQNIHARLVLALEGLCVLVDAEAQAG